MKATFYVKTLAKAVRDASQIISPRTPKDILKCVKLTVAGDECRIEASDSESHIIRYVRGVECVHSGAVLLPAAKLNAILSELRGETIEFDVNGTNCRIACGRAKLTLPTQPAEDFPSLAEFALDSYHTVSAADLRLALKRTIPFCDTVSTRYALGGINLTVTGEKASIQATDAVCASEQFVKVSTTGGSNPVSGPTVVGSRGASALLSLLDGDPVDFAADANSLHVRSGDFTTCLRLVAGRFPDFSRIFGPREGVIPMVVGPLLESLRQSCLTMSADSASVDMLFKGGTLLLSSKSADEGSSEIELPVDFAGEASCCLHAAKLIPALKLFDASDVVMLSTSRVGLTLTADDWQFMQCGMSSD